MSCYLCGSKKYIEVLNKKDGCIWTGASDEEKKERRKEFTLGCHGSF